jgi:hypothetical protein
MKYQIAILSSLLVLSACSSGQNGSSGGNLPPVSGSIGGKTYMKAKAEFDVSSSSQGSAQFQLVKKSFAVAPNCLHGSCTDYTDITVTNSGSTQFQLVQSQAQISQNTSNQNLSNIVDLKIGTLFDNNLTSCGGQKCTSAAIRIYTNDSTGVQGAGLYSPLIGKSVPLTVSGGSAALSLAAIPYFNSANPDDGSSLQIDLDPLAADKNVLSLAMADFADAASSGAGYTLSADFTQAGAGTYQAHVVVEYDLIGPSGPTAPPLEYAAQMSTLNYVQHQIVGLVSGGTAPYYIGPTSGSQDYTNSSYSIDPQGEVIIGTNGNYNMGIPVQELLTITDSNNQTVSLSLLLNPTLQISLYETTINGDGSNQNIGMVSGGTPPYSIMYNGNGLGISMVSVDFAGDIYIGTNTNETGVQIPEIITIEDNNGFSGSLSATFPIIITPSETNMQPQQMTYEVSQSNMSSPIDIGSFMGGIPPYSCFNSDGIPCSVTNTSGPYGASGEVYIGPWSTQLSFTEFETFTINDSMIGSVQMNVQIDP